MKLPLTETNKAFDLKFLLVGASGVGKTHLCATYTGGPIHFYMTDPGGHKTLHKLNKNRPECSPITIDSFNFRNQSFQEIWKLLQKDAKEGFFERMAEQRGLVVLPDSFTTLSMIATDEIAKKHGRSLTNLATAMRIQDWGVLGAWMKEFVAVINDLPCAAVSTAHIHIDTDENGNVTGRAPLISGRLKYTMGSFFDEVYLIERRGANQILHFKEVNKFEAKTRTFTEKSVKNVTLDQIAQAYLTGVPLEGGDSAKK